MRKEFSPLTWQDMGVILSAVDSHLPWREQFSVHLGFLDVMEIINELTHSEHRRDVDRRQKQDQGLSKIPPKDVYPGRTVGFSAPQEMKRKTLAFVLAISGQKANG